MTIADLLKTSMGHGVMEAARDPRFTKGYRDGCSGKPREDLSDPYQIGYHEGVITAAIRRSRGLPTTRDDSNADPAQ